MKCRTCQKWLHFYGEGELSASRQRRINQHLQHCSRCQEIDQCIRSFKQSVMLSNKTTPNLDRPEKLNTEILSSIRQQKENRLSGSNRECWIWLSRPVTRFAMGCCLLILVSAWFIQEFTILNHVTVLENKIGDSTTIPKSTFAGCLSDLHEFEKAYFSDEQDSIIKQAVLI